MISESFLLGVRVFCGVEILISCWVMVEAPEVIRLLLIFLYKARADAR